MAPQSKIMSHPDKEEIIKWLTDGTSVRDIESRLAQRYPKRNQAHLRASFSTIQSFKKTYLNLNQDLIEKVRESKRLSEKIINQEEIKAGVEATASYKDAIKNLAEAEMDTRQEILKVWTIIENRLSVLFDKASENNYIDNKIETLMQGYLNQFMNVISQQKKYEEGFREQVDVNINVNVMTDQVRMMQDALRETLEDVDPELTVLFMGKLNEKMKTASLGITPEAAKHSLIIDNRLKTSEIDAEFI